MGDFSSQFLKSCFFQLSPAEHSLGQTLFSFPKPRQMFFEANQKSYSMAFPNSHTNVCLSNHQSCSTLASPHLFDYFIDSLVLQVQEASFFTPMVSFSTSV